MNRVTQCCITFYALPSSKQSGCSLWPRPSTPAEPCPLPGLACDRAPKPCLSASPSPMLDLFPACSETVSSSRV